MNPNSLFGLQNFFQSNPLLFFVIIAWTLYWKGMALWKAARLNDQRWFIALLIINLFGALEIAYIYFFSKKKEKVGVSEN